MTTLTVRAPRLVDRQAPINSHRTCIKTEKRELHAIMVRLRAVGHRGACVWPGREPKSPCCKLPDPADSWLDARAGDTVLLWTPGKRLWVQQTIASMSLYRVFPVKYCDLVVSSAREWLNGVNGIHKSAFGKLADELPCDMRGYVPTQNTEAFDLEFDHIEDTHTVCGGLTGYGHWWKEFRFPQIVAEVLRLTQDYSMAAAAKPGVSNSLPMSPAPV